VTVGGVADQLKIEKNRTQTTPKTLESFIIRGPRLFNEPNPPRLQNFRF
jgi:hypothetical protein